MPRLIESRSSSGKAAASRRTPKLGGDSVVAFERFADILSGDSTFATNAPEVATEFDDCGR